MEELIAVMREIRDQLAELNNKIDMLTGLGTYNISDIVQAVEAINGTNRYDLTDVCNKLNDIDGLLSRDTLIS